MTSPAKIDSIHSDRFTNLESETLRREPNRIFDIARELRCAGLPPGTWFDEEGDYRFRYWKFTREPWAWVAQTESHPLPRTVVERFDAEHKGFDMKSVVFNRIVITTPATFRAFVELLRFHFLQHPDIP